MAQGIGARVARKEDRRFITGKGKYTDDVRMENQAYAAFVRSPHAHARVKGINASAAEAMDGVIAVLNGAELTGDGIGNIICGWAITSKDGSPMNMGAWSALATEKVRYVGDAVAVVIAETQAQARLAAEAVEVDYEELPAVAQADAALGAGAPEIHDNAPGNLIYDWEIGDKAATDAGLAAASHVTEMEITNNRLSPNPMEPRSAVATFDASEDHYTLYTTSQNPHVARLVLSAFYQVAPEHKLRVIAPDVGGGFGSKIYIYPEEIVCLWASMKTNRSVKWTSDRTEAFMTDAHGRDHISTAKMGFDGDGKIVGLPGFDTKANFGAYMSLFSSAVPTYLYATLLCRAPTTSRTSHCEVLAVYTNTVPVDAYRGAGRPGGVLSHRANDGDGSARDGQGSGRIASSELCAQSFPHQTPVIMNYDSGDFEGNLNQAMEAADCGRLCCPQEKPKRLRARENARASATCRAISRLAALRLRRRSARLGLALVFGKVPRFG